jgi:membrane fusion protein (multidrug efflux system)
MLANHALHALATTALAGSLVALSACETKSQAAVDPGYSSPPAVGVAVVSRSDLPLFIEAVATIDGYVNADIRARVRGFLTSQSYKDGEPVRKGQTLFTIDGSEYAAALESAKAALSRAKTAQSRAKIELDRDVALFRSGNLSQQDLDNARATLGDADGQVHAAQAALQESSLNLSYTNIQSPLDGVAGMAQVRVGNLVGQSEPTLLATVSLTDPMRVTFPISEVDYVKSPERFQHLEKRDLAWAKAEASKLDLDPTAMSDAAVELVLADGSVFAHRGVIVTVNRNIDTSTGTLLLQALVPNPDGLLRPGQYGRIRTPRVHEGHDVLTVPEKALVAVQGTYSVAVVGNDNKVALKHVELGARADGRRVVVSGVQEGDRIVVEGTQRTADGMLVEPHAATGVPATPGSLTQAPASAVQVQGR